LHLLLLLPLPVCRYESRIVQAMIRADGGSGDYQELVPPMLGIWNTLLNRSSDATWVRTRQTAPAISLGIWSSFLHT
jgi:hypothetical protein